MPFTQILTTLEGDRGSQVSERNADQSFTHRYGSCNQCFSLIQTPGLDHSYCYGCNDWIASRSVLNFALEQLPSASSQIPPDSPAAPALSRPESKPVISQQLDLWGGEA